MGKDPFYILVGLQKQLMSTVHSAMSAVSLAWNILEAFLPSSHFECLPRNLFLNFSHLSYTPDGPRCDEEFGMCGNCGCPTVTFHSNVPLLQSSEFRRLFSFWRWQYYLRSRLLYYSEPEIKPETLSCRAFNGNLNKLRELSFTLQYFN